MFALVREGADRRAARSTIRTGSPIPPGIWRGCVTHGVERVWVEKILDPGERLRDWPVCGTVGYEFLNDVCALFVDPAGEAPLTALWEQVSGDTRSFGEVAHEAKLEQVRGPVRQDVDRLLRENFGDSVRHIRDSSAKERARSTLSRRYLCTGRTSIRWPGASRTRTAARSTRPEMNPEIAARLLLERDAPPGFVTRFQQTTPAIMAKGVEDTAFYRYCRLLALNDVGGDPSRFGIDVGALPRRLRRARASASR